ncbi:MAG: hypothetical protein GZ090_02265 [Oxalobacteraceae bacterium]|nr:hypothetical protein [Oxalobacteraceae bacterium]
MFDLFGPRWHIGCSRTSLALVRRDRFGHHTGVPIERSWQAGTSPELLLAAQLQAALDQAGCAGARATLVLSDDWFRLGIVTPPLTPVAGWIFQTSAGTRSRKPCLSAALPVHVHSALQDILARNRLRGVQLMPHCLAAWTRWQGELDRDDWFGTVHDGRLMLISRANGKMIALMQQSLTEDDMRMPDRLDRPVRTASDRSGWPLPPRIVLCGEVPQPWTVASPGRLVCIPLREKNLPAGSLAVALAQAGIAA